MADNIKIVGEILDQQQVARYDAADLNLLSPRLLREDFGQQNDYIEYFVYNAGGNLLNINYSYKDFKLPTTSYIDPVNGALPIIEIDPVKDLQNIGYTSGEFKVQYNFFNNQVSDSTQQGLFLKEISPDRTEIRVGSTTLTNEQVENAALNLINQYTGSLYFVEYLINFGDNTQVVAVNTALNKNDAGYEILFKLYQPLPDNIQDKVTLWVVEEKTNPYVFDINLDTLITPAPGPQLRGPNFAIEIPNQNNVATSYQGYDALLNNVQSTSEQSYQQLLNLITSQSININVDYTDPSNFVFFSSAKERLIKFKDKIVDITNHQGIVESYSPLTSSRPDLINLIYSSTSSINNIISNFDGYESFLYFNSGSDNWPKTNVTLPYINKFWEKRYEQINDSNIWNFTHNLNETASVVSVFDFNGNTISNYVTASTGNQITLTFTTTTTGSVILGSSQTKVWYDAATGSAEIYDDENQSNLIFTLPIFIKDDENNGPYITFLNMIGHYFDNIWIYLKAVTDINLSNNNLNQGVSKDLVYYVLESLGIRLYNQYGNADNTNFLIGNNTGSANWDNNFTYTGSYLNNVSRKDLLAESYKRIYHNLPLLLKTKGTAYGLQTLVSVFGITGSVLPVKEYGGNLKSNTLNEYNNDKIRVVENSIYGNVLSPLTSLQTFPSTSANFRTNDYQYVDVSFSPQDKIDEFASASIAIVSSSWNIDDLIGDPRQQYSSSYPYLDSQKITFYSPLTASILPFTASAGSGSIGATNYNDFIRLIQTYDNSLFKMAKDYIPARANLSTGITYNSPVLERNKWSYAKTNNTSQISVDSGSIDPIDIGTEYTDLYTNLGGDKVAYYDGNISGSEINVYGYFVSGNFNPYLFPTASLTVTDLNNFAHSDFDVLFNNVSQSLTSSFRKNIEYIFGTTGSILSPVQLQDSYLSLKTHQLSRYDGVKIYSLKYNDYTSASADYSGDVSFGKTAVIDHNVRKLGLFTEIVSSSFLPGRNRVALKYLVDESGSLTELNQRNKHWEEVQNTFKTADVLDISLFDNQKFSNQKTTDGTKNIFDSGYSYYPILYFTGSCDGTKKIYFENLGVANSNQLSAINGTSPAIITGSTPINYPLSESRFVNNIFNTVLEGASFYTVGTATNFPTYSVQEAGDYRAIATFDLNITMSTGGNVTWSFGFYDKNNNVIGTKQTEPVNLTVSLGATASIGNVYGLWSCSSDTSKIESGIFVGNAPVNISIFGGGTISAGTPIYAYYNVYDTLNVLGGGSCTVSNQVVRYSTISSFNLTNNASCDCGGGPPYTYEIYDYPSPSQMYDIPEFTTNLSGKTKISFNKNVNPISSLTVGDRIVPKLILEGSSSLDITASLSPGSLVISSLAASTGYSSATCGYFNSSSIAASITSSTFNLITFNSNVSNFHNKNYKFVPNPLTGSLNSLYPIYGDVDYGFIINPQDIMLTYLSDGTYAESRVTSVTTSGSLLQVQLDGDMSSLYRNNLMSSSFQRFLVLKRVEDETNANLTFAKRDGKTSYGFIVPDNLSPDVLNNIDTITKEVKQKLLADQQGSTTTQ